MEKRNKDLAQKYGTYKSNVEAYHEQYPEHPAMGLPTFEELKVLDIEHRFWNIGHLTHPNEPWAVDGPTQMGIQAFRTSRSCAEELERIACEVQHMIRSALLISERLSNLLQLSQIGGSYLSSISSFQVKVFKGVGFDFLILGSMGRRWSS
jgi:hypothetical protein